VHPREAKAGPSRRAGGRTPDRPSLEEGKETYVYVGSTLFLE